jgi:diguanylate cyclase (GGDEF)-like protein
MSIKKFFLLLITLVVLALIFLFYDFYLREKEITNRLIKTNLQSEVLNLNAFLRKNFAPDAVGSIASQLDSHTISDKIIAYIKIVDDKNKTLYTSPQYNQKRQHDKQRCLPITDIMQSKLSQVACYDFYIKHHQNLQQHLYHVIVGIDREYIRQLQTKEAIYMLRITLAFTVLFFVLVYFLAEKYLIVPLEALRNYAYYSEFAPKEFFIKEFESIRYSLEMTFKRLKTEQKNLYTLSTQDPLTGLYNRNDLKSQVKRILASAKRGNKQFAIIFLDLDNFKNINDSIGHHFGDVILKKVADVLRLAIRENDIPARIGGDEFLVVLPEIDTEAHVVDVLQRIKKHLSAPIHINNERYKVTVSMGVALFPKDGTDFNTLLKHADIAMYKAKELGKNNYQFFTDTLNEMVQKKIQMHSLLSEALEQGYFQLFYQPKVDIGTQKIVACEALLRLVHPQEGIIAPDRFIPLAEESGMIVSIGEWIVQEACQQINRWQQTPLAGIKLSINVSGVQLAEKDFLQMLQHHTHCIHDAQLDIELTESVFIGDFDTKIQLLHQIKALGVTLSLDDFGTGYSSLSYLRTIPFDTLKIDKSFIDSMQENKAFINMIIGIAKDLQLEVVAEGVENEEQLAYLKEMQCEQYQGYLCSKPLPAIAFEKLFGQCNSIS